MPNKSTTAATSGNTADAAYEWLGAHPGHHNLDAIRAALPGTKQPTLKKALTALTTSNQIRHLVVDGADCWTADPAEEDVTHQAVVHDSSAPATADTSHGDTVDGHTPADTHDEPDSTDDTAPSWTPDMRVMTLSYFLHQATDSVTASELAQAAGWPDESVWLVLAAMHQAGAAVCDRGFILDPAGRWTAGDTAPTDVNMTATPSHVTCSLCGNPAPIPGVTKAGRKRGNRSPRNPSDEPALAPGELYARVKQWVLDHPGRDTDHPATAHEIARDVGRPGSTSAVVNVLDKMPLRDEGLIRPIPNRSPRAWATAPLS